METGDRRYREFVALVTDRQSGSARVPSAARPAAKRALRIATGIVAKQIEQQETDRVPAPANVARAVLLVEPDAGGLFAAQNALRSVADVEACSDFQAARARLVAKPPDLLVTNLRLHAYNGLHLVHLAAGSTRCIVYASYDDLVLAREVQAAGAFYERSWRLPRALAAYAQAVLPPCDRRSPTVLDRRQIVRGGRRCTDR